MILLLTAIVVAIAVFVALLLIHADTSDSEKSTGATPIITDKQSSNSQKLHVDEKWFSFDLPLDWKLSSKSLSPTTYWQWQSAGKNAAVRTLTLYLDNVPPDAQAINMLVPLFRNGSALTVGQVSGNCVDFTSGAQAAMKAGKTLESRWQGISFICNTTDPTDQIVGTGSSDGVNTINLSGPASGRHSYYFTYLDQDAHPSYSLFTDALVSFKVK